MYTIFQSFIEQENFLNIFRYITFRAILAALVALLLSIFFGKHFIGFMQNKNNVLRKLTPEGHKKKAGTPSMGGIVIVLAVVVVVLLFANLMNGYVLLTMGCLILFAGIGLADDLLKMFHKKGKGLSFKGKMLLQIVSSLLVFWGYAAMNSNFSFFAGEMQTLAFTNVIFPFTKELFVDLGIFYSVLAVVVLVGSSNAVNLTDGLDGLAIGLVLFVVTTFLVFSYASGHKVFAEYLKIPYIVDVAELTVVVAAICGSCLGFLWYNAHPAEVFMGDTGSLSLGATVGLLALLLKVELLLIVVGGVFVVEAASVILQVGSYRFRGKRIFRMAPLHHHFELLGWKESKIILRFWIFGIVLVLVTLSSLKIR